MQRTYPTVGRGRALRASLFSPLALVAGLVLCTAAARGELERLEITRTLPLDEDRPYGLAGPYEVAIGKATFAVDPGAPHNARIADLGRVARDADGKARFEADFFLIRPLDDGGGRRGNGTLLLDVVNRGRPTSLSFNYPDWPIHPPSPDERGIGDGFLMRRGFTIAGVGWQFDVPTTAGGPGAFVFRLTPRQATGVTGLVRSDIVLDRDTASMPLGNWGQIPYAVSDRNDPRCVLTVRDSELAERREIPRPRWRFDAEGTAVVLEGGFEKGRIYEVIYPSRDPAVVGLGLLAVRDFALHLRDHPQSPVRVERTIAVGASQTGRFLRHFLYAGLNAAPNGSVRVLDGVFSIVAGAGRGSFNHRFAQPSRASLPFFTFFYPTDVFPFTGAAQRDPRSGLEAGLLRSAAATRPKVFHLNTSVEYWQRGASLVHTAVSGARDIELLPEERLYVIAAAQHGPARFPPSTEWDLGAERVVTAHPHNPANYFWVQRALLVALDAWVAGGTAPPPSRYPRFTDATLATPGELELPAIPGLEAPRGTHYQPRHIEYGRRFREAGIVDRVPPRIGDPYPVFVPRLDADGNELGGLRLPEISTPLATYTGFNPRAAQIGAPRQLAHLVGAFLPFPRTAASRRAKGDPRPSIEERYPSRAAYFGRFARSALDLVDGGYLLAEDLAPVLEWGELLWEVLVETEAPPGEAP